MPRSLLPREHGAYVQLAAPLVAAFAAFGATVASALLAVAAALAFIANEPLLVVLGHRGKRAKAEDGRRARRLLAILAPAAASAGIAGLALGPRAVVTAAIVAVPSCVLVLLAWRKQERTFAGELVAAVALTGAAAPVAVAAGATSVQAMLLWGAWAAGYAFTVVAVHRVIARHRRRASAIDVALVTASLAAAGGIVFVGLVVALPLALASIVLLIVAPSATHLRAIGFVLVAASLASIALAAS